LISHVNCPYCKSDQTDSASPAVVPDVVAPLTLSFEVVCKNCSGAFHLEYGVVRVLAYRKVVDEGQESNTWVLVDTAAEQKPEGYVRKIQVPRDAGPQPLPCGDGALAGSP
jgi:transcription elongation factor Elf1